MAALIGQAAGPRAMAFSETSDGPTTDDLIAVQSASALVLEMFDDLVTTTRQNPPANGLGAGFAGVVGEIDALYQATIGRVPSFDEFSFALDLAIIDGQTVDLSVSTSPLVQAELAAGDVLLGTMLAGEAIELSIHAMDLEWLTLQEFQLDEASEGLFDELDAEQVEAMELLIPRVAVIEADAASVAGFSDKQGFFLIEIATESETPSRIIAMPIGVLPELPESEEGEVEQAQSGGGPIVVPGGPPRRPQRRYRHKGACVVGIALSTLGVSACISSALGCPASYGMSCRIALFSCCATLEWTALVTCNACGWLDSEWCNMIGVAGGIACGGAMYFPRTPTP